MYSFAPTGFMVKAYRTATGLGTSWWVHAESIHSALRGAEIAAAILHLPRLHRAEEVSDWLDFRRGTLDELLKCVTRLFAESRSARRPSRLVGTAIGIRYSRHG